MERAKVIKIVGFHLKTLRWPRNDFKEQGQGQNLSPWYFSFFYNFPVALPIETHMFF